MGLPQNLQHNVEVQQRDGQSVAVATVQDKHFFSKFNGYPIDQTTLTELAEHDITTILIIEEDNGTQYQFTLEQYQTAEEWYNNIHGTVCTQHIASLDDGTRLA